MLAQLKCQLQSLGEGGLRQLSMSTVHSCRLLSSLEQIIVFDLKSVAITSSEAPNFGLRSTVSVFVLPVLKL